MSTFPKFVWRKSSLLNFLRFREILFIQLKSGQMQLRLSHKNKMQFHQNFIPKTNWQNLSRYLSPVLFKKSCLESRHMLWEESGAFSNSDSFKYQPMRDITSVSMVKIATFNDWDIRTGLFEVQRVSLGNSKTRSKKHFRSLVMILGHFSNSWILKAFLTSNGQF